MQLSSSAFATGQRIPRRFTCDGEDLSPPLSWHGLPAGTRSLVALCDDPDAPGGTWHHWAAYDIPPACTKLAEDAARGASEIGFKQAINDFNRATYGGPCPPPGHGPDHYRFRLIALSVDHLDLGRGTGCRAVEQAARKHALGEAILVGIYER